MFPKCSQNRIGIPGNAVDKKVNLLFRMELYKSGRQDLNLRPLRPERSALARLSYAPQLCRNTILAGGQGVKWPLPNEQSSANDVVPSPSTASRPSPPSHRPDSLPRSRGRRRPSDRHRLFFRRWGPRFIRLPRDGLPIPLPFNHRRPR